MKAEIPLDLSQGGEPAPVVARPRQGLLAGSGTVYPRAGQGRIGLLFNKRAHHNKRAVDDSVPPRIWRAAPLNKAELDDTLASFAQERIGTIIIAGGDGTIRDVLSRADRHFPEGLPRFVIMPSGKTNALAGDLGIDTGLSLREILSTLPRWRTVRRSPLEIRYGNESEPRLRGFVFGTGAFVRSTQLAQSVHRAGAVNSLAVGLALAGAAVRTLFGAEAREWLRGDPAILETGGTTVDRNFFVLLASTLERLPLGARPFGRRRSGLKLLSVDAPPRKLLLSAAAVALGSERKWLENAGCRRIDAESFGLRIDSGFVLDGERFPGGELTLSQGAPIDFLVPA